MRAARWMIVAVIGLLLFLGKNPPAHAAFQQPPLEIEIAVAQTTVTVGAPMTWRITLAPRTPQDISSIELRSGDERVWAWPNGIYTFTGILTSTTVLNVSAVPRVAGDLVPLLEAHYFVDGEAQAQLIAGDTPVHARSAFEIPITAPWDTLVVAFLGVVTGSLVALIPAWRQERAARKRQEEDNQDQVHGLLRSMASQAEYAADNGVSVELGPLRTVFEKEGLFAVVRKAALVKVVHQLWKVADRHNSGLSRPGGAQRSEDLRHAAQELASKLKALR